MRRRSFVTGAALAMLSAAGCDGAGGEPRTASAAAAAPARPFERLFWSGHSLTDRPLPDQFAAIAKSLDRPVQWNAQMIHGSNIKTRSQGTGNWSGYRQGANQHGNGLDVAAELLSPRTVTGGPYDALIITEQHTLLGNLVWHDAVRHLRHFHDRAIDGNAGQTTYLYQSWLGIDDRDDPRQWIAYEKAAATAWRCVATRINVSLAAAKRTDRIVALDAGAALATLVERAAAGHVEGLVGQPRVVIEQLFRDDVHLTPLGSYFVALFVYAELSAASPEGAWAPAGVGAAQAQALQAAAWAISADLRRARRTISLEDCHDFVDGPFMRTYLAYLRGKQARSDGVAKAYATWLQHRVAFSRVFSRRDGGNPLVFDAAADRDYWLPAS